MDATEFTVYELWTSGGQGVGSGSVMACELGEEDCVPPQFANCERELSGYGIMARERGTPYCETTMWSICVVVPSGSGK